MPFDITSFTMPHMLLEMASAPGNFLIKRGDPGEVREYTAVATTDAVPISNEVLMKLLKSELTAADSRSSRWQVMCKIIGNAQGIPFKATESGHAFVPLFGKGITEIIRAALIKGVLVRCMTSKDFSLSADVPVLIGDKVKISVTFNRAGEIDLSSGELLSVYERPESDARTAALASGAPAPALATLFDFAEPSTE